MALCLLSLAASRAQDDPLAGEWLKYRDRFVTADGRVHDTGNANRLMAVALAAFSDLAGSARTRD